MRSMQLHRSRPLSVGQQRSRSSRKWFYLRLSPGQIGREDRVAERHFVMNRGNGCTRRLLSQFKLLLSAKSVIFLVDRLWQRNYPSIVGSWA